MRREWRLTQEHAEAGIALANEQEFAPWLEAGTHLHGWALVMQGHGEAGIAQMRQGIDANRTPGAELVLPIWLASLGEAYRKVEQPEEGLAVLAEALAVQTWQRRSLPCAKTLRGLTMGTWWQETAWMS